MIQRCWTPLYIIIVLITASRCNLLFYGAPNPILPSGFGVLNSTGGLNSITPAESSMGLKGIVDTMGMAYLPDDHVLVYGNMQWLGDAEIGGFLVCSISEGTCGSFRNDQGVPLQQQGIEGAVGYGVNTSSFVVVGDITLTSNPSLQLGNIALCSIKTVECQPIGTGLSNFKNLAGLELSTYVNGLNQYIYVSYLGTDSYYYVLEYQTDHMQWNTLARTLTTNLDDVTNVHNIAFHSERLFAAPLAPITTNPCSGSFRVEKFGFYDTLIDCWSNIPYDPAILYAVSLAVSEETVYALVVLSEDGTSTGIAQYVGGMMVLMRTVVPAKCILSPPLLATNNYVFMKCLNQDFIHQSVVYYDIANNSLFTVPDSETFQQVPTYISIVNQQLWVQEVLDNTMELYQYSSDLQSINSSLVVEDLWTDFATIWTMCGFGAHFFIQGAFTSAGGVSTPNNMAVFNTTSQTWYSLVLPNYNNMSEAQGVVCTKTGDTLVIGYLILQNQSSAIGIAYLEQTETVPTVHQSPVLNNFASATALWTIEFVDSNLYFLYTENGYNVIGEFSPSNETWTTQYLVFQNYSQDIETIEGNDGILYIGGKFDLSSCENMAKYDIATGQYLPMESIMPGPILAIEVIPSSVSPVHAVVYAGGYVTVADGLSANGVAGANAEGTWVDNLMYGYRDLIVNLVYLDSPPRLYVLSDNFNGKYFANLYVWNFQTMTPVNVPGFMAPQAIDSINYTPPIMPISSHKDHFSWSWVVGGIALAIFAIGVAVTAAVLVRRRRKHFSYISIPLYDEDVESTIDKIIKDSAIKKIDEEKVIFGEVIGGGGQGIVQKGKYSGKDVALKSLQFDNEFIQETQFLQFIHEIKLLSQMDHRNIIQFIGIVVKKEKLFLVTELMDTDLRKVASQLSYEEKVRVAKDIANAMKYLHAQNPPVLHRDLKPSNVLISKDGRCKVTDFGISRVKPAQTTVITRDVGTLTFEAPEVLIDGKYNEKADVYSYGVLLAELFGNGRSPFAHVQFRVPFEFLQKFMNRQIEPVFPEDIPEDILTLIKQCLSWDHADRPTFPEIYKSLKTIGRRFVSVKIN